MGGEGKNVLPSDKFHVLDKEIKPGWGGKEVVGGGPRNEVMTFEDAVKTYEIIKKIIKKK